MKKLIVDYHLINTISEMAVHWLFSRNYHVDTKLSCRVVLILRIYMRKQDAKNSVQLHWSVDTNVQTSAESAKINFSMESASKYAAGPTFATMIVKARAVISNVHLAC